MMKRTVRSLLLASAILVPATLAGCEETMDPPPAANQPTATAAPGPGQAGSSGSAYGQARDSAKKTAEDLEKRSEDLAKQFEDLSKDN